MGIAGASGSGKTTLAEAVAAAFPGRCAILPLDAYYLDLGHLSPAARARANFDRPQALDWPLLLLQVGALLRGKTVARPVYSFATHTRTNAVAPVPPSDLLLVEGLFALWLPALVARYELAVFIDAPDPLCLARRLARDTAERGRTPASVRQQYAKLTRPMFVRHVLPTRRRARLVLDGSLPAETNARRLLAELEARGS